jgi:hypothetical protein
MLLRPVHLGGNTNGFVQNSGSIYAELDSTTYATGIILSVSYTAETSTLNNAA